MAKKSGYRKLQEKAKKLDIPANQSAEELEKQIAEKEAAESQTTEPTEDRPESEVPPTSGPDDVMSSAGMGEGSIDPETGKTVPSEQPFTGDLVEPATEVVDGGPQPPQPGGGDAQRPLEQTAAPGFKSEGAVAAAKAADKSAKESQKRRAERMVPDGKGPVSTGIEVGHPRALNTQLTITGRGFPPRRNVRVELSGSRFPTGEKAVTLRANEDGVVQAIIIPTPGEQSVSMSAEGASETADFNVVDPSRR